MYNDLATEMLEALSEMSKIELANTAEYQARIALKNAIVAEGYSVHFAWKIVTRMKISVNDDGLNHPKFKEIVEKFAEILSKLDNQVTKDMVADGCDEEDTDEAFLALATAASFTLNI